MVPPRSGCRFRGRRRRTLLALILLAGAWIEGGIGGVYALELGELYFTAMPTWIYNGFTEDSDGDPVQGSDVSPLRMTFGGGIEITINRDHRLEPQLWIYLQEYAALRDHDKTVPTQIETGSVVGDVANTLGIALSLPWLYTIPWAPNEDWRFSAGAGLALIFRIPISEIDGSDGSEVGSYWIGGRFIYPQINLAADYRITDDLAVGAGLEWYIPFYNLWADEVGAPFLDETMIRFGLRLRWRLFTTQRGAQSDDLGDEPDGNDVDNGSDSLEEGHDGQENEV